MQLFECLEQIWSSDTLKRHAVLIGEGGSGKTTQLKKLWYDLSHNSALNAPIPIYVPLYGFNGSDTYIRDYVIREYCGQLNGENDEQNRTNLLHLFKQTDDSTRRFVLLLDGINEAQNWNKIFTEIDRYLSNCKNLQIIISSRYKLNDFNDFTQLQVKPLTVDFVKNKLKENSKYTDYQFSDKLLYLLTNPMYLSMFLGLGLDIPEIETKNITSAGEIFKANNDRLIKAILYNLKKSEESDYYKTVQYCLKYLFPYFAYCVKKVSFSSNELFDVLEECNFDLKSRFGKRVKCIRQGSKNADLDNIVDNILIQQHLIEEVHTTKHEDSLYKFSHENYLQFYSALYYYNEMTLRPNNQVPACLTDSLIDENLLSWIGELFGEHNFMHKTTLQESSSPLESWLHNHCEIDKSNCNGETLARATRNVLEIMKTTRKNHLTADYSSLDLTICDFYGCSLPNSNFENAKVNKTCFVSNGHSGAIGTIAISPDDRLIATAGQDGIRIWNLQYGCIYAALTFGDYIDVEFPEHLTLGFSADNNCLALHDGNKLVLWEISCFNDKPAMIVNSDLFFDETPMDFDEYIFNSFKTTVACFAFSPNGKKFAIGYKNGKIRVLNSDFSSTLRCISLTDDFNLSHDLPYIEMQICFSQDEQFISVSAKSHDFLYVELIEIETGKRKILKQALQCNSGFYNKEKLVFSYNMKYFMMIYYPKNGETCICDVWGINADITSMDKNPMFSYQTKHTFVYGIEGTFLNDNLLIYNPQIKLINVDLNFSGTDIEDFEINSFKTESYDLELIDLCSQQIEPIKLESRYTASHPKKFSLSGKKFVSISDTMGINTYDMVSKKSKTINKSFKNLLRGHSYNSKTGTLSLIQVDFILTFNTRDSKLLAVVPCDPYCKHIASSDTSIYLFDDDYDFSDVDVKKYDILLASADNAEKFRLIRKFNRDIKSNWYEKFLVSPNDKYIAAQGDRTSDIIVWDVATKKEIAVLSNGLYRGCVYDCCFITDEEILFIGSDDIDTFHVYTWNIQQNLINVLYELTCANSILDAKLSQCGSIVFVKTWEDESKWIPYSLNTCEFASSGIEQHEFSDQIFQYGKGKAIFCELNNLLIEFPDNANVKITHLESNTVEFLALLDTKNIKNSNFKNTNISDELKELIEMNGGIVE